MTAVQLVPLLVERKTPPPSVPAKRFVPRDGKRHRHDVVRQAGIDRSPACAVVGGKKDTAAISPGKEIRAGDGKSIDISIRQAGIDRSPACAVVGGKKNTATISPGKEIRARDGKSTDISIRQAGIDRSPACAVVGGKKDAAAISPGKEIRAADGKRHRHTVFVKPVLTAVQLVPLLVERKTPLSKSRQRDSCPKRQEH